MLSSSTEPQPVHTASPRAASNSMSVPPQPRQTRPVMLEPRGPAGPPPLSSPLSARGPQPARPVAPPPSAPHSREAAGATTADSPRQIRHTRAGRAASNDRARGTNKGALESLGCWDRTADLPGGRKRSSKPGTRRPRGPRASSGAGLESGREGRGEAKSAARDQTGPGPWEKPRLRQGRGLAGRARSGPVGGAWEESQEVWAGPGGGAEAEKRAVRRA